VKRSAMLPIRVARKSGQSVIEYVLMMALLSTLTFGFVKFYTSLFDSGLRELPQKAGPCISNLPQANQGAC